MELIIPVLLLLTPLIVLGIDLVCSKRARLKLLGTVVLLLVAFVGWLIYLFSQDDYWR